MKPAARRAALIRVSTAGFAAAALVVGCTGAGSSPSAGSSSAPGRSGSTTTQSNAAPVNWSDCGLDRDQLGIPAQRLKKLTFECGFVSVPLDYADPARDHLSVLLLRVHDVDNTTPVGSLVVNPGGPGGSGTTLAVRLARDMPADLVAHFDIVGFDPRGVNGSDTLECLGSTEKDELLAASPDVRTADGLAAAKALARHFAQRCRQVYDGDLRYYNTEQAARDIDQIRQALGDDQVSYLGFSYGTELGAQYLHRYPDRVRVAVLDGAVDPLNGALRATAEQLQGFEDAFDRWVAWCRTHAGCETIADPRQDVTSLISRARRKPLPGDGDRRLTAHLIYTAVRGTMYSPQNWRALANALLSAQYDGGRALLRLADEYNGRVDGHYNYFVDAFNAITCNDSPAGLTDKTIQETAKAWHTKYPLFGLDAAASLAMCELWQPKRTVPPLPTAPDTDVPVLVLGNLHDPVTPYQGAVDLAKTLGNAELLTWNGEGHTSYLQGSGCIDHYVEVYILQRTLPPRNTTCPR